MRLYYLSMKADGGNLQRSQYRFYFFLALLYMWLVVVNAPAMVVWVKGLRSVSARHIVL